MWLHTDASPSVVYAATPADVFLTDTEFKGSRTHANKIRVHLAADHNVTADGVVRRRTNSGNRGAGGYYAATYDEWGWFLAVVFDADPTAKCEYYANRDDFHAKTNGKYDTSKLTNEGN